MARRPSSSSTKEKPLAEESMRGFSVPTSQQGRPSPGGRLEEQGAIQKTGYVLSYKAIRTEGHNPTDCSVILMTEYKDLATMEPNTDKAEQFAQQLFGGIPKIDAGYMDRSSYRDIIGSRLAREIILEPKE